MKSKTAWLLLLLASMAAAQTTSKAGVHRAVRHPGATADKLPPGIPVVQGEIRSAFSLRYQDYKIGTGPLAEPNKLYHVQYTGYLAATGQKFDSSYDHRAPILKDGKPVMGPDGKPEMGEAQPLVFAQGYGHLIPGFDQGFLGMRVGGKRRIFIPWQLGYGTRSLPARLDHPAIPPMSDLVFDVELLDVTDLPTMPVHPLPGPPHPGVLPGHPMGLPRVNGTPGAEQKPAAPSDAEPSSDTKMQPK